MERDLVCGRRIDSAAAVRLEYHGKTYYFCSDSCKREFEDRPDEYADHPSSAVRSEVILDPIRGQAIFAPATKERVH